MNRALWLIGISLFAALAALMVLPRDMQGSGVARHFEASGKGPPLTVSIIGTSLTAGKTWPGKLADAMGQCSNRLVLLDSFAKPGAGSSWGKSRAAVLYSRQNDLLIMEFAINDADLRRGIWPEKTANNIKAIVTSARKANPNVRIIMMVPHLPTGIKRWLVRPFVNMHYETARKLAKELHLILADFSGETLALRDGAHASDKDFAAMVVKPLLAASGYCATPKQPPILR